SAHSSSGTDERARRGTHRLRSCPLTTRSLTLPALKPTGRSVVDLVHTPSGTIRRLRTPVRSVEQAAEPIEGAPTATGLGVCLSPYTGTSSSFPAHSYRRATRHELRKHPNDYY